jgi:hypothetical protein
LDHGKRWVDAVRSYFYEGGVYVIENKDLQRAYVGSTRRFGSRIMGHQIHLDDGDHYNTLLQLDYITCGAGAFRVKVAMVLPPSASTRMLLQREDQHMATLAKAGFLLYNRKPAVPRAREILCEGNCLALGIKRRRWCEPCLIQLAFQHREVPTSHCASPDCSNLVTGRSDAVFCSARCRLRAWRIAQRETIT